MNPNKCEKRMGNGAYCKKDWEFSVSAGLTKKSCATHLSSVVKFMDDQKHGVLVKTKDSEEAPVVTRIGLY